MSITSTGLSHPEVKNTRLVTDVTGACNVLDIGRDRLYTLLNAGEIESYLDGRSRKVVIASLENYVTKRIAASQTFVRSRHPTNKRGGRRMMRRPNSRK